MESYEDSGLTGAQRPGFQRMMADTQEDSMVMVVDNREMGNEVKPRRAVGYTRGSSELGGDRSLEAQREVIRERCASEGWELVEIYAEAGLVAWQEGAPLRPEFLRLMADARVGSFDTVVVSSHDRLTRSVQAALQTAEAFEELGIELVSLNQ